MIFSHGDTLIDEPIKIRDGEIYQGEGSHMPSGHQAGSSLKPADGYDGPCFTGQASNGVIRDLRVDGFRNHGIDIKTDSSYILDNVAVLRCEGDGFRFNRQLGLRCGTIMAYSNKGAGVYCGGQLVHIEMLIGDNNDVLLRANGNDKSSIHVGAFRSERWTDEPRQNVVFDLSMRGGCVDVGQGYVHVGNVPQGFTWINVDTPTVLSIGNIVTNNLDGYSYGYYCERTGISYEPEKVARHKLYFGIDGIRH